MCITTGDDMSWYSPSQEEAEEAYYYNKSKYYNAANERSAYYNYEQDCISQKNQAKSEIKDLSSDKVNFEKRLEGIEKIIKMLEGTGGPFSTNVPEAISKAASSIQKADSSYKKSIKMTGGTSVASLENAFSIKSVENDPNSAAALEAYKAEKVNLEQKIANIKSEISTLSDTIDSLNSQISYYDSMQASLKRTMNSCAYEMNHYQKFLY